MWWLLILLAGCSQVVEVDILNETINISAANEHKLVLKDFNKTVENLSISKYSIIPNENNTIEKVQNKSIIGNRVRFYINTREGLISVMLEEGKHATFNNKTVEASFVGESEGIAKAMFKVNGQLSKILEEKESDMVGGTYIFVMEILYR